MHTWKKVLNFVMALTLLAGSVPVSAVISNDASVVSIQASAYDMDENGFDYVDYGSYVEIVGYEGEETEALVIPSKIGKKPVTRIAKDAFADKDSYSFLTSITIPETIEYIGANAFAGCVNVKEGYIPSKFIGICAVAKEIIASENVTQLVQFEVIDNHKTKVSTKDGLASLYTDYKIDGTSLADRALAVPEAVAQADVEGLTADSFKNFVKKYSTIEKVTIENKTCEIGSNLIPEGAVVSGYRNSTAQKYAIANESKFVPIDGTADADKIAEDVSISMAYSDYNDKNKFTVNVSAVTGDYSVYRVGVISDKNNLIGTDESLTTDDLKVGGKFTNSKAEGKNTASWTMAENGFGLWVRPYVVVDNGSGNEDNAVTIYGDAEFIYSEAHILNNVGLDMTTSEAEVEDKNTGKLVKKLKCNVNVTNNKEYEIVNTGVVLDQTGTVADESSAKALLTLDSNFEGKKIGKNKDATGLTYSATIGDNGKGVWAVGYTTVKINGYEVTKYTEPVSWTNTTDPFADASVEVTSSAVSATKFKMSAVAKAEGLTVLETGIITNKTGSVTTEENAAEQMRLTADLTAMQKFVSAKGGKSVNVSMTDIGNGIWYVGFMVVESENGEKRTIYSAPQYVQSDVQEDGVSVNMSVSKVEGDVPRFRFDVISRTGDETAKQSGIIFNRNGAVTKENAKEMLTVDSAFTANGTNGIGEKTTGTITSYSANVKDTDGDVGIWCVGYVITDKGTYYTQPVYIHDEDDVAAANVAVNMVYAPVEGTANKYRFDVTSVTGDTPADKMGVIVSRDGSITDAVSAAEALVLNSTHAGVITTKKTDANTYAANITDSEGKGIWVVGYVVVKINGEDVVKYTAPAYVAKS